jgi:KaiC/GvpD/RAD55 family RecA-like ATPase
MATDFSAINLHNEEKFVSYLMKNPQDTHLLDFKFLLNSSISIICYAIEQVKKDNLYFTVDELYHYVKQKADIPKEYLQKIYDEFIDFENLDFIIDRIKKNYISNKLNIEILEDLLVEISPTGEVQLDKLDDLANKIKENISLIKGSTRLLTTEQLADNYREILKKRDEGLKQRDLGYKVIKDACPNQANVGEMTLLFAPSGAGKTAMSQNMQMSWVSRNIPVIKFGTEMTIDSEMDRTMAMRLNISPGELYKEKRDDRFNSKVERALQGFSQIKNYLHVDESSLSLGDVDNLIRSGKEHFRKEGVYKNNDEYTIVVLDLASMIKEISGEYGEGVEKGATELHNITKNNGIHSLLVVQANENRARGGIRFKKPEEIDHQVFVREDIKGGAGWFERCRMVLSLYRPLMIKKQYFPDRMEEWLLEEDILWLTACKNNNGPEFRLPFIFNAESFRILPYIKEKKEISNETCN